MAVTLIRHTTPNVAKGTCYGRSDLGLAKSFGTEAALVLADIPGAEIVVSSPLTRCHQLAQRISAHVTGDLIISSNWIEMDFGSWEGIPWADVPRAGLDAWAADFMRYAGHGGESVADLETRVTQALAATPDNAIVVTHSGCIRTACAIYGIHDGWDTETPFGGKVTLP